MQEPLSSEPLVRIMDEIHRSAFDSNRVFFSMKAVLGLARRCSDVCAMNPHELSFSDRAVIVAL